MSLVIPTLNRSEFLIRVLRYYAEQGVGHTIWIGDSSEGVHRDRLKAAVDGIHRQVKIEYRQFAGVNDAEAIKLLLDEVRTSYAAFLGDDDFLVPGGIQEAAAFLERHPDYSIAHGSGILFGLERSGPYGRFHKIEPYNLREIMNETARERLCNYLQRYFVTLFSVRRTEQMREAYKQVSLVSDRRFTELLPASIAVIQGKAKQLRRLYLVRQTHDQRYFLPDLLDWLTSPNWLPSYQVVRERLVDALVAWDGSSADEARAAVEKALWGYLARGLSAKWNLRYGKGAENVWARLARIGRSAPGVRHGARLLRSISGATRDSVSLRALLRPSATNHQDFMPIYRLVSGPLTETLQTGAPVLG